MKKMIDWISAVWGKHDRFVKFCLVGGMNSILSVLLYNFFLWININYILAYAMSYLIPWVNSFYWNGTHVFKSASKMRAIKYFILYGGTYLLGQALLIVEVDFFDWNKTLSQFPIIALNTVLNYTGSRLWVFKARKNPGEDSCAP